MAPNELLKAILGAPVDLLYNGGIGTYVKASDESHAEVGDRANDSIRVDGAQIRARVIGEGGNLGMTQRGRIEAALHGVILNTDAIDNSAGVDCSDHEVNIKILIDTVSTAGQMGAGERADVLHSLAGDVGAINGEAAMMESLWAFKRAGASGVLTYFALEAARKLNA